MFSQGLLGKRFLNEMNFQNLTDKMERESFGSQRINHTKMGEMEKKASL